MENPAAFQNAVHLLDSPLPRQVPNDPAHFNNDALALLRDFSDLFQAERGPLSE